MGTRAGEVSDTTAIVWTRLTKAPLRNNEGVIVPKSKGTNEVAKEKVASVEQLEGSCPGAPGKVRLRYSTQENLAEAVTTDWVEVTVENDFIHSFALKDLQPATTYYYESQSTVIAGKASPYVFRGIFRTAPVATAPTDILFTVMTCQGYPDRGHPDGHDIYPSMLALKPAFTCLTGDLVYYDNDAPAATTVALARYHWERMFSLPRLIDFNRAINTYWLKDDHDTLKNDAWPAMKNAGELSFAEGQRIFRQQAPLSDGPEYRTVRWGRDLQVWFTEGRNDRSPNTMVDGPDKTILGAEQKAWLKRTLKESDTTWKVLVSPTPIVGPDRETGKSDNHSNKAFSHEGDELRSWFQANVPDHFFVICGDRHWQYHSVHPETRVNEFSAGAASNEHASGSPGENKAIHRFHRVQGGFLSATLQSSQQTSQLTFRLHDVKGKVSYESTYEKALG